MRPNINLGIIQLKLYVGTYQCGNIFKIVSIINIVLKNNDENKISQYSWCYNIIILNNCVHGVKY